LKFIPFKEAGSKKESMKCIGTLKFQMRRTHLVVGSESSWPSSEKQSKTKIKR
jgi:hypothetical protein